MKSFTIILYTDPNGSFAKIKREVLDNLELSQHISGASFQQGSYVFLDQEQDLPIFCQRLNEHGTKIKFTEKHSTKESRIRGYEKYAYVAVPTT